MLHASARRSGHDTVTTGLRHTAETVHSVSERETRFGKSRSSSVSETETGLTGVTGGRIRLERTEASEASMNNQTKL